MKNILNKVIGVIGAIFGVIGAIWALVTIFKRSNTPNTTLQNDGALDSTQAQVDAEIEDIKTQLEGVKPTPATDQEIEDYWKGRLK